MKSFFTILFSILLLGCSEIPKQELNYFENSWEFKKEENTWIKTRIYPNSFVDEDNNFSRLRGADSSVLLYSDFFFHQPGTNDDQYWRRIAIVIYDTSELKIDTLYKLPNNLINVKIRFGGAYNGQNDVFNINGYIKFEHFSLDSCSVKTHLNGQRYFEGKLQQLDSMKYDLDFYKNGMTEYEYSEQIEKDYWDNLYKAFTTIEDTTSYNTK